MLFARFTERLKPVVDIVPDGRVFRGETVTLTCDIQQTGDWQYRWHKDYKQVYSGQNYIISSVDPSHRGVYRCRGTQSQAPTYSRYSDGVTLTVSGESSCVLHINHYFVLTVLSAAFGFITIVFLFRDRKI